MSCLTKLEMELHDHFHQHLKITKNDKKDDLDLQMQTPTLKDHMDKIVHLALHTKNVVLVESHNIQITPKDIKTLQKGAWVNDQVMDFYFSMIASRSANRNLPKVYAFSTFFYNKLLKKGHNVVGRWTKNVDLFSYDLILIPVHVNMHWFLVVIHIKERTIRSYDSLNRDNKECLSVLKHYIQKEYMTKHSKQLCSESWQMSEVHNIPEQMNNSDCRIYACKYAEFLSRQADLTFTRSDMTTCRHTMIYEILMDSLISYK